MFAALNLISFNSFNTFKTDVSIVPGYFISFDFCSLYQTDE